MTVSCVLLISRAKVISSSSVLVGAARGRSEIVFVKKYE
jgi:hypothetical protein